MAEGTKTTKFTYDASNRILELLDVDAKGNILLRYEMAYDAQGNIIRRTSTDKIQIGKAQTQTYSYNYDQLTEQNGKSISNDIGNNLINQQIQSANPKQSFGKDYLSF